MTEGLDVKIDPAMPMPQRIEAVYRAYEEAKKQGAAIRLTQKQLASLARVGVASYQRGTAVIERASEQTLKAWRNGEIGVEEAYKRTPKIVSDEMREKTRIGALRRWRNAKATSDISLELRNSDAVCDYTIDMLVEEIKANGAIIVDTVRAIIEPHADLAKANRHTITRAIKEYIITGIIEMKGDILK